MSALYTAIATSTGDGRAGGRSRSEDGALDVTLATPKEMGGPGGGTNPEQLFAAGWAACFHSAIKAIAAKSKIPVTDSAVVAEVALQAIDGGGFGLSAKLDIELGGIDQATGDNLVAAAHQMCPYSNATRGNIDVKLTTTVA